jgi:hypothetical protein
VKAPKRESNRKRRRPPAEAPLAPFAGDRERRAEGRPTQAAGKARDRFRETTDRPKPIARDGKRRR